MTNLIIVGYIKSGDFMGKVELQMNEKYNVNMLFGLTVLIFFEMMFMSSFDVHSSILVLFRLTPSVCEHLFVFRLFNRYLLFLHLPKERKIITQVFAALAITRKVFSYFYLEPILPVLIFIVGLEVSLSIGFLFATRTVLMHHQYLRDIELPQWEKENYADDIEAFKITYFHRKISIIASNFLHIFILNGTMWIIGHKLLDFGFENNESLEFETINLGSRILPHTIILINYLFLSMRDKNHLRKEKNFIIELREVLIYKGET